MSLEATRHQWLPLALASSLEGRPKRFVLLGENLVGFRGSDGPVVFKDWCAHRGAALSNGWITDGNLTCPYHGWQYDRSGACVAIPSLMPGEKIPSTARVVTYRTKEAYGLVWVCLSSGEAPFPSWPDDAWEREDYRVFCSGEYRWNANAMRVIENGLDFSHFNFAHRGLTELADGPVVKPHKVDAQGSTLTLTYEDGNLSRDYMVHFPFVLHIRKRVIRAGDSATWSSDASSKVGEITTVSLIASPTTDEQTLFFGFLSRNHSLDMTDAEFGGSFDQVLEQDRIIVESQMPKLIPEDMGSELHVRFADIASIAYRRMFKAARMKHLSPGS